MENKRAHLEMIQGVINRLSNKSFLLKGWSVVMISALFALATKDSNPAFVNLAYIPAVIFWGLDGYFLWQERIFRTLYNKVRCLDEDNIDFSMETSNTKLEVKEWLQSMFSLTLLLFHGIMFGAVVIVMILT